MDKSIRVENRFLYLCFMASLEVQLRNINFSNITKLATNRFYMR